MVFNKKFVEIGRVAYIVTGPYVGKLCAIIDIIDQNKALVVGPVTGVPLRAINFKSLHLTRFVLNFRHSAKSHEVKSAWERKAIDRRWAQSQWAKKIACRDKKAKMTDYDRFKLMRAKQSRNKIIRLQVGKLRKKPLKDVLSRTQPPKPKSIYKTLVKSKKYIAEAKAKKLATGKARKFAADKAMYKKLAAEAKDKKLAAEAKDKKPAAEVKGKKPTAAAKGKKPATEDKKSTTEAKSKKSVTAK